MRILMVLDSFSLGGIELMILRALPYLKEQGIQVDFCCTGTCTNREQQLLKEGVRIHRIPKFLLPIRTAKAFEALLQRECYDLVHCNFGFVSGGFAWGASLAGVPIIVHFHSAEPTSLTQWKGRLFLDWLRMLWLKRHRSLILKHSSLFIGASKAALDGVCAREAVRKKVVYNGVPFKESALSKNEARQRLGWKETSPVILHVGNFRQVKNQGFVLEVFKQLNIKYPSIQLVFVGEGRGMEQVKKEVSLNKLDSFVHFVGQREDVDFFYTAADVLFFPSLSEGFGNVLVEAQGAGLPIVASDIPAHRESVAPSQHRFLFSLKQPEKAQDLLIEQLSFSKTKSAPWVKEAKNYVLSRFSIENFTRQLVNCYSELSPESSPEEPLIAR